MPRYQFNWSLGKISTWLASLSVIGMMVAGLLCGTEQRASAFPMFARKYNLPCARCHSMVPRLTPFGYAFYRAGFRLPTPPPEKRSFRITDFASLLGEVDLQRHPPGGGADITFPEVDLSVVAPFGEHWTAHTIYIEALTHDQPSHFDETWGQYNSAPRGRYLSVRAGQMPIFDGYQFLGQRSITITDPMLFGSNGPLTGDSQGNFALSNLERGVELGYNRNPLYARISWLQGIDESGAGDTGIPGHNWGDVALQAEYFIGKDGSVIQALYYNGNQNLVSEGFTNNLQRVGIFGTWGKNYHAGQFAIPAYRWEVNGGFLWGEDTTTATGHQTGSWGGVIEADAYFAYRTAIALRYDSVRPSAEMGTPVTEAWTVALQHRASNFIQLGVEYRHQNDPGADSIIGAIKMTY